MRRGEIGFITKMIEESILFKNNCGWFTTLVSKKTNLPIIESLLKKASVSDAMIMEMGQGQKVSRVVVWTYFSSAEINSWGEGRWKG